MARRCSRCFLRDSLKTVNILVLLLGVALIIYSLWLNREWLFYAFQLFPTSAAPKPWFIYTSLGVGIAVCFSSLYGSIISNYFIPSSTLCAYIFIIGCLVFLEAAIFDFIFFHTDIAAEITTYVGEYIEEIERFVKFHVEFSRVAILMVLVAQTNVVVIAVILWVTDREPTSQGIESQTFYFTESFLVPIRLPQVLDNSTQACIRCGNLRRQHPSNRTVQEPLR